MAFYVCSVYFLFLAFVILHPPRLFSSPLFIPLMIYSFVKFLPRTSKSFSNAMRPTIPLGKSAVFAISLSGFSILAAAQLTNDKTETLQKNSSNWFGISTSRLKTIKEINLANKLQSGLNSIRTAPQSIQRVYILASES